MQVISAATKGLNKTDLPSEASGAQACGVGVGHGWGRLPRGTLPTTLEYICYGA